MLLGLRGWWGRWELDRVVGVCILGDVDRMEGGEIEKGFCGRLVNVLVGNVRCDKT